MIDESVEIAKQNQSYKTSSQMSRSLSFSKALHDLFNVWDEVHGAGSAASAKSQLDWSCQCAYKAKAGILQKKLCWPRLQKGCLRHGTCCMGSPGIQSWQLKGWKCSTWQVISASSCELNWSVQYLVMMALHSLWPCSRSSVINILFCDYGKHYLNIARDIKIRA